MMRCATLMPSPMMFGWPLMSLTSFTGPRLIPMRTESSPEASAEVAAVLSRTIASRSDSVTKSASSGSPRKLIAAPSPVSRMIRSLTGMSLIASERLFVRLVLSRICSVTGFFEYPTRSMNTTLQMKVRLAVSCIVCGPGMNGGEPASLFSCENAGTYAAIFGRNLV